MDAGSLIGLAEGKVWHMSIYTATIRWTRDQSIDFAKDQYSRAHLLPSC